MPKIKVISCQFFRERYRKHEKPFNDYQALVKTPEGRSMSEDEKADAIMGIFAGYKITFLDAPEVGNAR